MFRQLIANTVTSVIAFLMVFVIQNSVNRDSKAIQLKLAELIRATQWTRNAMVTLKDLSDEQIIRLRKEFEQLSQVGGTEPIHDVSYIPVEKLTRKDEDDLRRNGIRIPGTGLKQ